MPKRSRVTLEDVAAWDNLTWAAYRAARGKRTHGSACGFMDRLDANLTALQRSVRDGSVDIGNATSFRIFDPKPRTIHAPVFRERVLHHALMRYVGPVLERSLVADTFACRVGKGAIAVVKRAQQHARRYRWYGKLDVRQYFASIHHATLLTMLRHKFKDRELLLLLERIVASYDTQQGRGLPIGALTSQNFANFYLNPFDRFLLEQQQARGMVRYMDDVIWWCDEKNQAVSIAAAAETFLEERLSLQIRPPMEINRSDRGILICGYRVFPGVIRLSRRRRRLYQLGRRKWESRFRRGLIDETQLQAGYAATLGITLHAESTQWRRRQLELYPPLESCEQI